jgi:deoxyribodipyrimidine photo-lyase
MNEFPTTLSEIYARIDALDVTHYATSRNYVDGGVSKLSPYISRGVISLPFIKDRILSRATPTEAHRFIYELCWREYFQRIWFQHGNKIFADFNSTQAPVHHTQMVDVLTKASTGIDTIDSNLNTLFKTGYIHNHVRMYTASIACNIARAHWFAPASWMYYHLLDGDLASNMLSWQWVAGTFSSKKYYCNQENINKYCNSNQINTFLDTTYEALNDLVVPETLKHHSALNLETKLLTSTSLRLDESKPVLLYNSYNLSPTWRSEIDANRVLVLEPSHFKKHPVSEKVIDFILKLSKEIPDLQIYTGEVADLTTSYNFPELISKNHPAFVHYPGIKDEPEWMFPSVSPRGSFTAYWKACEKVMNQTLQNA